MDLEPHFQDVITRKWMTSFDPVSTICATLEDYFRVGCFSTRDVLKLASTEFY